LEQQLIVARNALEKDKLALARAIGLPLAQSFTLTDKAPYEPLTSSTWTRPFIRAFESQRSGGHVEQTKAAEEQRKAATADRLPTFKFDGDYGDIGTTLAHSHGTATPRAR